MQYDSIHELRARLYKSGTIILWKGGRAGKSTDELTRMARQKRLFYINRTHVRSACVAAWLNRQSKFMLFIAFTFPFQPTEDEAAQIWELLLNNLRVQYKIKNYVWVKEIGEKGKKLHYHILFDRDRVDIKKLQTSYNSAISNVRPDVVCSNNSVRLGNRPVVNSVKSVAKYLSKYIAKKNDKDDDRLTEFDRRAYGFSEHLQLFKDIDTFELCKFEQRCKVRLIYEDKFFEIYQFHDSYFDFCQEIWQNDS